MKKLLVGALVATIGCVNVRDCKVDSDCESPGICSPTYQFCITPPDDAGAPEDAGPEVDAGLLDSGMRDSGSVDAGLEADAGIRDAGPTRFCEVHAAECAEACLDDGGCVSYFVGLSVEPMPSLVRAATPVALTATLVVRPGVTPVYPSQLIFSGSSSGTMPGSNGTYSQQVTPSACGQSTPFGFIVSLGDGGFAQDAGFTCDGLAPTLTLFADAGTFERDELVPVLVTADEPLLDAGVTLGGVRLARVAAAACSRFASTGEVVGCFLADFSQPKLNNVSGAFALEASGADRVGLAASSAAVSLAVTRIRWQRTVPGAGQHVRALTVGPDGTVFVGTDVLSSTGTLAAIDHRDGHIVTSVAPGAVQSLAAFGDAVYAASNSTAGSIGSFNATNLSAGISPCTGVGLTYSGIALWDGGTAGVLAVGSVNSTNGANGNGCLYSPVAPLGAFNSFSSTLDAHATSATEAASNVVIAGSTASYLRKTSGAGAFWQPVQLSLTPTLGGSAQLTQGTTTPALGQALSGSGFVIGSKDSGNHRQMFLASAAGIDGGNLGEDLDTGVPSLSSSNQAYVGRGNSLVRFDPTLLGMSGHSLWSSSTADVIRTAPVLTKAPPDGGVAWGYAVTEQGSLVAFRQTGSDEQWSAVISPAAIAAHPTFDCNRASPVTRTGILYIGDQSGVVTSVIVDSPALFDGPGAWPKYQRSSGNAGNDDLANFPTNWPGCP